MKEYVVERTQKRRIKTALTSLFVTILLCFFFVPLELLSDLDTVWIVILNIMRIIVIIVLPLMIHATVVAIKDLWNDKPYLIIRKDGLIQNMDKCQSGLIEWGDIKNISIIHDRRHDEGAYEVKIYLKEPEKHIKDPKALNKINKLKEKFPGQSDLSIFTGDFKNEGKQVVRLIQEYYNASRKAKMV